MKESGFSQEEMKFCAKVLSSQSGIPQKDILNIFEKRWEDFKSYAPDLFATINSISWLYNSNNDIKREEIFHKVETEVFDNLPLHLQEKLQWLKEAKARIYREFILMVHDGDIEITAQEILYHKAKIAIKTEWIPCEILPYSKPKILANAEDIIVWDSCSIPVPENLIEKQFHDIVVATQSLIPQPYFIVIEKNIENILSRFPWWKIAENCHDRPESMFLPIDTTKNIIISTSTTLGVKEYARDYIDVYSILLLRSGNIKKTDIDNKTHLCWEFLIARKL